MDKNNQKYKPAIIVLLLFGSVFCLFLLFRYGLELGTWKGRSFEMYMDKAYTGGSFTVRELPEGAQDFRWQCYNFGLAAYSYAGFTLTGREYDDFIGYVTGLKEPSNDDKNVFDGKIVSETMKYYDDYGGYIGFPKRKCEFVIDDHIEDYTILYYDSYNGAGSHVNAVIVNPDTGRFVVINGGSN